MIEKDKSIQQIISDFDFIKVKRVMRLMNWSWFGSAEQYPSVDELKAAAVKRLSECWDGVITIQSQTFSSESGGFCARAIQNSEGVYMTLAFSIESQTNYEQFTETETETNAEVEVADVDDPFTRSMQTI